MPGTEHDRHGTEQDTEHDTEHRIDEVPGPAPETDHAPVA